VGRPAELREPLRVEAAWNRGLSSGCDCDCACWTQMGWLAWVEFRSVAKQYVSLSRSL
jgi:hypothetical protein